MLRAPNAANRVASWCCVWRRFGIKIGRPDTNAGDQMRGSKGKLCPSVPTSVSSGIAVGSTRRIVGVIASHVQHLCKVLFEKLNEGRVVPMPDSSRSATVTRIRLGDCSLCARHTTTGFSSGRAEP